MKPEELHELDFWIANNVFPEKKLFKFSAYTTDPAAAMMVLDKCLERYDIGDTVISKEVNQFWIRTVGSHGSRIQGEAETIPLAICLFAQNLFAITQK